MGCCESKKGKNLSTNELKDHLLKAIDLQDSSRVSLILRIYSETVPHSFDALNAEIVRIKEKRLNPLAYCIFKGNLPMFIHLLDLGCSISAMDKLLESQGIKAINIISANNYIDILHEYLPIYMVNYKPFEETNQTIDFDYQEHKQASTSAIHIACKYGSLSVVNYFSVYFLKKSSVPDIFNVHALDEKGENSALIACRHGQFEMVKMLYEKFSVNLHLLNSNKENSYMVTVCGFKKHKNQNSFIIMNYLFNVVNVDICYMYEELLLAANSVEMVEFIEQKLRHKGISARKTELELNQIYDKDADDMYSEAKADCGDVYSELRRNYENDRTGSLLSKISYKEFELYGSSILEADEILKS